MCTVTLLPLGSNDFVLTSNRDEAPSRRAMHPDIYVEEGISLWYPKDPESEGSWIGVSSQDRAVCLLNGGFQRHKRSLPYRQSRGVVVTHLLKTPNVFQTLKSYDLNQIEPFTLIAIDWSEGMRWFELVWDGDQRHLSELNPEPKIWSSSTLYDEAMKQERKEWFNDFKQNEDLTSEAILGFHHQAGASNDDYGVIMDRGFVKTTSITQIKKTKGLVWLSFEDLLEQKTYRNDMEFPLIVNE